MELKEAEYLCDIFNRILGRSSNITTIISSSPTLEGLAVELNCKFPKFKWTTVEEPLATGKDWNENAILRAFMPLVRLTVSEKKPCTAKFHDLPCTADGGHQGRHLHESPDVTVSWS